MEVPKQTARGSLVREGLAVGFAFALADALAAGPWRTPLVLLGLSLLGALATGFVLGGFATLLRRPGFALGSFLALANALNVLSLASKDLALSKGALSGAAVGLLAVGIALLGIALARGAQANAAAWFPAALIPGGALLWNALPHNLFVLGGLALLPALGLVVSTRVNTKRMVALLCVAAIYALLMLPTARESGAIVRTPSAKAANSSASPSPAQDAPNVLLIVVDTLRADCVTPAMGGPLGAIVREGVHFEQAISPAPWTLPAMSSLMSGLYPSQHGAVSARQPLPDDVTTIAERFRDAGYSTAAFTGGAFVGSAHRLDQGFDGFDPTVERSFPAFRAYVPLLWRIAKNRYAPLFFAVRLVGEYRGMLGALAAVREWQPDPERPFFLLVHSYQVHDYYLYDPRTDDAVRARRTPPQRFAKRFSVHPEELAYADADELAWFRAIYDERWSDVQRSLGELFELVQAKGGARPLITALTSDHGEGFDAETHRVHHGGRLHDDLLRVPLLLHGTGLPAQVVGEQVSTLDLAPTLIELAGLPPLRDIAGRSLVAALRDEAPFPSPAFAEEWEHQNELLAVRQEGWKQIRKPGRDEIYDLRADAGELRSLEQGPEELEQRLEDFRRAYPRRVSSETELDAATQKHLQELGYTGVEDED